jgi:hypothetical protein
MGEAHNKKAKKAFGGRKRGDGWIEKIQSREVPIVGDIVCVCWKPDDGAFVRGIVSRCSDGVWQFSNQSINHFF